MASMIDLSLRDSVTDMEKPSHPSHKAWYKSLRLLRDLGVVHGQMTWEYSYCCVDQEHDTEVVYLYSKLTRTSELAAPQARPKVDQPTPGEPPAHCSEEMFKAIEASCKSETSKLSRLLSPLLKAPLSKASVTRLPDHIRLVDPAWRPKEAIKCLEFIHLHNFEHYPALSVILDAHTPGGSCHGLSIKPVSTISSMVLNSSNGDNNRMTAFYCLEWNKGLQDRKAVFSDSLTRRHMKSVYKAHRPPLLQALGKADTLGDMT